MSANTLYKRLLENQTTAVLLLDNQLKVTYINPAAEALLQVSRARMLNEHVSDLFYEQPDSLPELKSAVQSGHPYTKREATLHFVGGRELAVDYSVTPLNGSETSISLLIELSPLVRMIRISKEEELLKKNDTTRSLVRGMAHEIKNPLGGIRGAAQLLARAMPNSDVGEYTDVIIEEADRLRNLVDRMLGPRTAPRFEPANILEVTERVYRLIEAESEKRVQLIRDYDPSIPEFMGDKEQLIQAVLNITRNAMQALLENKAEDEPKQVTFRTRALRQFTIGSERHRLVCRLDIIDNGPGIPKEMQEQIFFPLISGRAEGTGLGLSISQSILNLHNGLIECESEPGKTNFIILIPLEHK